MSELDESRWPPVTVVIPAYNLAAYVGESIQSVLNQTYAGSIAIVVLDDGSSDPTLQVIRTIAAEHPCIDVYTQPNAGRVKTRNRLLELSETELVAWLDGDDMATPNWLTEQIEVLIADDRVGAVSGQGYAMTYDNYPMGPIDAHPLAHAEIHQQHLSGKSNVFFQSCTVVKKSAVLRAGGYRGNYPAAEDYDLWLRLGELYELRNVDRCHLIYRVHGTSANATQAVEQRQQGRLTANEARARAGLAQLAETAVENPPPHKDLWNRSVYRINIALKAGNPRTALKLAWPAVLRFPTSPLVWCLSMVALADTIWLRGNQTSRFRLGETWHLGHLPGRSFYRLFRGMYYKIKKFTARRTMDA